MRFLHNIRKSVFGYDVFISYSRRDSLDYAYALAQLLMKKRFECYIDQLSNLTPGKELPPNIEQAVKRSTAFVLIGSAGAQTSAPIKTEITLFLENNRNKPLIPITIEGAIDHALWAEQIAGLALINDTVKNLEAGTPARDVLDRIENALRFTKKAVRLRNISALILLGVLLIATSAAFFTTQKAKEASLATAQKNSADSLKKSAQKEKEKADSDKTIALKDKVIAQQLAGTARQEAQQSGLIAQSNYLINLSNDVSKLPNRYAAVDTALKAFKMNRGAAGEKNVMQLFLNNPFIYGCNLPAAAPPNKLLNAEKNTFYYLDAEYIKKCRLSSTVPYLANKIKITGNANLIKDSIVMVLREEFLTKYVVNASNDSVAVSIILNKPLVYVSTENLINNRFIHDQAHFHHPIDSTIELTEYDGKIHPLVTIPLKLDSKDRVEDRRVFYSNGNYFLMLALSPDSIDKSRNRVRLAVFTFTPEFRCVGRNIVSIGKGLFPEYNFTSCKNIIKTTDGNDSSLLFFFDRHICRYSLSYDKEASEIRVSNDYSVDGEWFVPEKKLVIIKDGPNLMVSFLSDLQIVDFREQTSYSIKLPDSEYSIWVAAGKYIYILTMSGCFYVVDIDFNPRARQGYMPVPDIIQMRNSSRSAFLRYISR